MRAVRCSPGNATHQNEMQFVAEQQVVYMKRAEGELNELEAQSAKKEVRISAFA